MSTADKTGRTVYAGQMVNIVSGNTIAEIAALIGDVSRANILLALMSGRALTAGELGRAAGVSPQTTSGHLAKLLDSRLISLEKQQGRHRYFRLASPEMALALEALMTVAAVGPLRYRPKGPKDEAIRLARTCYDHMAGRLGTTIADALCQNKYLVVSDGAGIVTEAGHEFLCEFGIDLVSNAKSKRVFCRTCVDWSERRPHLAGRLGAAILDRSLELGWVSRVAESRSLRITKAGNEGFLAKFGFKPTGNIVAGERTKLLVNQEETLG